METIVYLIRHAAYASPEHILPVRLPGYHLSEAGKAAAEKLADTLRAFPIRAVFASPMERTRETADMIAKPHDVPVVVDDRLLEVRSPVQGKPESFMATLGSWKIYETDWYRQNGGETPEEQFQRMDSFMKEKVSQYQGKEIIAVSHGDPIMFLVGGYQGIGLLSDEIKKRDYVQMGTGFRLTFDGNGKLITSQEVGK